MAVRGDKHVHYLVRALVAVFFVPSSLAEGQVRLAGGSSRCSGRVEVYYNSRWGTVCDDSWDVFDGEVVCRQLDCGTVVSAPTNAKFGEGTGPIWLDNVLCSGTESSLTQCEHNGFGRHDCDHGDDAGVVCSDEIQLVGPGSSRCSGRVEVRHNSSWGTVCDDNWDLSDAQVVCRHLECGTALVAITEAKFGQGSDPTWLDDVGCSGSESSLLQCDNSGFGPHYCNHGEDAGVICSERLPKPSISLTPQEVRRGENVTVTCSIIGLSGGTFSLRRSQQEVQTSPSNPTTFRLSPVTFESAGPYYCQYQKKVSGQVLTSPRSESLTLRVSVPLVLLVAPSVGGGLLLIALVLLLLFLLHKKRTQSNQTEINLQSNNKANQYIKDSEDDEGYYASVEAHAACADREEFANEVNKSRIEEEDYDYYVKMDAEEQKEEDDTYVTAIEADAEDQDHIYSNT